MPQITWKKILLIIGFIAVVVGIAYLLYYLFFKPAPPAPGIIPPEAVAPPPTALPPAALPAAPGVAVPLVPPEAAPPTAPPVEVPPVAEISEKAIGGPTKITTLTEVPAQDATLAADGKNLAFYNKKDGKFYRIGPDGKAILMSDKAFYEVEKVTWAPNTQKAVLEYPDGSNIVYDFEQEKQVTLPSHWQEFDFSPQSSQLVMKSVGLDEEDRWLAVSNTDGSGTQAIEPLGRHGDIVDVKWSPNNQIIATFTESVDFDKQRLFFLGLHGENFKMTVMEGRGFQGQWSPQGDRILYSVYNRNTNYNPTLWIVDAKGENIGRNRTPLNVPTWADKCTFSQDNKAVYCAVPRNLREGSGLVPQVADEVADDFYKIDTVTGTKTLLAIPADKDYTVDKTMVSDDGNYLYFTDKKEGRLHQIELK